MTPSEKEEDEAAAAVAAGVNPEDEVAVVAKPLAFQVRSRKPMKTQMTPDPGN